MQPYATPIFMQRAQPQEGLVTTDLIYPDEVGQKYNVNENS